jgi:hypothetical protein
MFMKKYITPLLFLAFISCSDQEAEHRKDLVRIAEEVNQKCPQMLDSETRLEGIEVKDPNTLVYHYALINLEKKNVDTVQFYRMLWPGIISNIKTSAEMKKLRENNTVIEYLYTDKARDTIYTFKIGAREYN